MVKLVSLFLGVVAIAACGSSKSNNTADAKKGDSGSGSDSGSGKDAPAGTTITIAGTTDSIGGGGGNATPVGSVTLTPYTASGGSAGSAVTSDATTGTFTLTVDSGFEGYIEATATGYLDTYVWPPASLSANVTGATVQLITQANVTMGMYGNCGVTQDNTEGIILLKVVTGAGDTPVTGATVTATPAGATSQKICYTTKNGANEKPTAADTATDASGVVLVLNAATGWNALTATATGDTFTSTSLYPVAATLTTTLVVGT